MIICEIEDMTTGCTYIKRGDSIKECVKYFQDMFFIHRDYKILWIKEEK